MWIFVVKSPKKTSWQDVFLILISIVSSSPMCLALEVSDDIQNARIGHSSRKTNSNNNQTRKIPKLKGSYTM